MIERPPIITERDLAAVMLDKSKRPNEKLSALIDKINDDYEYWDTVKYKTARKVVHPHKNCGFV